MGQVSRQFLVSFLFDFSFLVRIKNIVSKTSQEALCQVGIFNYNTPNHKMVQISMVRNFGGSWIEKRGERSAGYRFTEKQILRKPHELIIVLL